MSLIRTGLVLAAVIMVLPTEEKKQAELTSAAARGAEQTATFCERNPSTCGAGRELWALFLRKAEFGMELAAGLVRDQLARANQPEVPTAAPVPPDRSAVPRTIAQPAALYLPPVDPTKATAAATVEPIQPRRTYPMDHPSRWR